MTIDVAQTMPVRLGRALLSAAQRWQSGELPAMLLLAGTPDLPRHLSTLGTTFWERSEELPIGRLGPGASAAAIRIPLEEGGQSIAEEALQHVVVGSHWYPFFLQVWGKGLWERCGDGGRQLTCTDLD